MHLHFLPIVSLLGIALTAAVNPSIYVTCGHLNSYEGKVVNLQNTNEQDCIDVHMSPLFPVTPKRYLVFRGCFCEFFREEEKPYEDKCAKWARTDYIVGWGNDTFSVGPRRKYFRCWAPNCVGTCPEWEGKVEVEQEVE